MGILKLQFLYFVAAVLRSSHSNPQRDALPLRQPVLLELRVPVLVRGVLLPVLLRLRLPVLPVLLVDVALRPSSRPLLQGPPCAVQRRRQRTSHPASQFGDTASLR